MFEYQFPSPSFFSFFNPWAPNPLLKSIHIQGPFITIFGRKTVGEELHVVLQELKGRVINPNFDGLEHHTCHNMIELPFWASTEQPHVHYTMADRSTEQGITDLITSLFQRHNPAVREQDYQAILANIESDRVKAGDTELPDYVKKSLAQIDRKSPFILSENSQALILDILSKYGEYCTRPSNDRCRELLQMYIIGPLKPVLSIYDGGDEETKSAEADKRIELLLQPLVDIGNCLMTARKEPYNTVVLQQIQNLIQQVNVEELVKLENRDDNYPTERASLQERLDFISRYTQEQRQIVEAYKKTTRYCVYSFFSRISQVFYSIFSSPNPRTA
ncbi:MAG TPA: hypothetical protein VIJ14_10140 [Rhabdochlamydiaceae bacterium]